MESAKKNSQKNECPGFSGFFRGTIPRERAASLTVAQSRGQLSHPIAISGVAFSFIFQVGANLTITSFIRLSRVNHGFQAENVLFMAFDDDDLFFSLIPCPFQLRSPPIFAQVRRLASMVEEFRIPSSAIRRMISPAEKHLVCLLFFADPISPIGPEAEIECIHATHENNMAYSPGDYLPS